MSASATPPIPSDSRKESLIEYPCDFPIKVMGARVDGFAETMAQIAELLEGRQADLVLSDMAPNLTGIRDTDEARSVELAEVALETAQQFLKPGGSMLIKMFQHADSDRFIVAPRKHFERINRRKPAASRQASREFYVVAAGFRG